MGVNWHSIFDMGGVLMAILEKTWQDYEYQGAYMLASAEDLRRVVRRAAKAANQRLLRRERAGRTKGVYAGTMAALGRLGRSRFAESKSRLDKMSINELRHEYTMLRDWLSAKTSTLQGLRASDDKRYQTARERGFEGTLEEWNDIANRFFTKEMEGYYSSDILYQMATQGNTDLVDRILRDAKESDQPPGKGRLLIDLVTAAAKRRRGG